MISFYDLAAKEGIKCWSPHTWKVRYTLNFKGLPYQTVYVNFGEISEALLAAGIGPSQLGFDGNHLYTVPSIVDDAPAEPKRVTDSLAIVEYLDARYPDKPQVILEDSKRETILAHDWINERMKDLTALFLAYVPDILGKESSVEYYTRTRTEQWGKSLEEAKPQGAELVKLWERIARFFDKLETWYIQGDGAFIAGDEPNICDFTIAGYLQALRAVKGEDSEEWQNMSVMSHGRWMKLLNDLEKYASVDN